MLHALPSLNTLPPLLRSDSILTLQELCRIKIIRSIYNDNKTLSQIKERIPDQEYQKILLLYKDDAESQVLCSRDEGVIIRLQFQVYRENDVIWDDRTSDSDITYRAVLSRHVGNIDQVEVMCPSMELFEEIMECMKSRVTVITKRP